VGFDGGEGVSINSRLNDISFVAEKGVSEVKFNLCLSFGQSKTPPKPVGVQIEPEQCISLLGAAAAVYGESVDKSDRRKVRLRELLNHHGVEWYLGEIQRRINFPLEYGNLEVTEPRDKWSHIGIHQQSVVDLFYIGLVIPLGQISVDNLNSLAGLADDYGTGELRLTPWQNIILPNIYDDQVDRAIAELAQLNLGFDLGDPFCGIVACSGKDGCKSAHINTHSLAHELAEVISKQGSDRLPTTVHISGCHKSCAEHSMSDITIVGLDNGQCNVYKREQEFRLNIEPENIPLSLNLEI
jgi:ferredoxin-nitrite reductase